MGIAIVEFFEPLLRALSHTGFSQVINTRIGGTATTPLKNPPDTRRTVQAGADEVRSVRYARTRQRPSEPVREDQPRGAGAAGSSDPRHQAHGRRGAQGDEPDVRGRLLGHRKPEHPARAFAQGDGAALAVHDPLGEPHAACKAEKEIDPTDPPSWERWFNQQNRESDGYKISQKKRKLNEEIFGWLKQFGRLRRPRLVGRWKIQQRADVALATLNMVRMVKLLAT